MNIGARIGCWAGGLPYDEKLEYIESSGTQYIDIGYYANQDTVLDITYVPVVDNNRFIVPFGARTVYRNKNLTCFAPSIETFYACYGNDRQYDSFAKSSAVNKTNRIVCDKNVIRHYLSGTLRSTFTFTAITYATEYTMALFCYNNAGTYDGKTNMRFFSCDISENDTALYTLIPVLKNGVACLYDKTGGRFFYNIGTGTFGYKKQDGMIVSPT